MMVSKYEVFVKVIEKGSFTAAAQELGYSQSAVSQTVKNLEEELHTILIRRSHDGLALSEDGESYYPYIQAVVNAEANLNGKQKEMAGLVDQTIHIGAFTSVSRNLLPVLMQDFRKVYPHVHFELRQGDYDEIHQWVKSGQVDFGFLNPENFVDIQAQVIYRDTMAAVMDIDHPLAKKKSVSLKDLAKEEFILLDEGKNSIPLEAFAAQGIQPHLAYKIYDDYSILAMVRQGMGVSLLYQSVVAGFAEGIAIRPLQEPIEREIAVAYEDVHQMRQAARTFLKYVIQETPRIRHTMGLDKETK